MGKSNSIKYVTVVIILFGLFFLGIIKIITSKRSLLSDRDLDSVVKIVRHADNILKRPKACFQSFNRGSFRYSPTSLNGIKSENGFLELKQGSSLTQNLFLSDITIQLIERTKEGSLILLKYRFQNTKIKKDYRFLKTFYIEKEKNSFSKCVQINEVRI